MLKEVQDQNVDIVSSHSNHQILRGLSSQDLKSMMFKKSPNDLELVLNSVDQNLLNSNESSMNVDEVFSIDDIFPQAIQ